MIQSNMRFKYDPKPNWPKLAWLAVCRKDQEAIKLHHGPGLETRQTWFCEANWDGQFEKGDFDRTGHVFGSGGRLRDHTCLFVSSASTCDRLHTLEAGKVH